jgi:MraZ protein
LGRKLEIWSESRWYSWMGEVSEDDELPQEALSLNL